MSECFSGEVTKCAGMNMSDREYNVKSAESVLKMISDYEPLILYLHFYSRVYLQYLSRVFPPTEYLFGYVLI